MAPHAAESDSVIPPMPERTPKALREAIADAYDLGPVPAFMARWWGEYALARDPKLDAHVRDLEHRAAYECTDITEAKTLLEEAAKIHYRVRELEPGE